MESRCCFGLVHFHREGYTWLSQRFFAARTKSLSRIRKISTAPHRNTDKTWLQRTTRSLSMFWRRWKEIRSLLCFFEQRWWFRVQISGPRKTTIFKRRRSTMKESRQRPPRHDKWICAVVILRNNLTTITTNPSGMAPMGFIPSFSSCQGRQPSQEASTTPEEPEPEPKKCLYLSLNPKHLLPWKIVGTSWRTCNASRLFSSVIIA